MLSTPLTKNGLADNTIIVLWSDHGYHLRRKTDQWKEHDVGPLDPGTVHYSGTGRCTENAAYNTPVELLDIYPTLNALCGLPEKDELEGLSLSPHPGESRYGANQAGHYHQQLQQSRHSHREVALYPVCQWQ